MHQIVALQIRQLRERLVANRAGWKQRRENGNSREECDEDYSPYERTFTRMRLGVLPHAALARKMLSAQFALVFALGQMFRLVGHHLLVGIEALSARKQRSARSKGEGCRICVKQLRQHVHKFGAKRRNRLERREM